MKKILSSIWEIVKIFIVAAIIVIPVRYFLFQPFIVKGESMEPNFKNGDYLIVDELSYRFREPKRGEVIVFRYPQDFEVGILGKFLGWGGQPLLIKRIIGLPGEVVEIKDGKITISKGSLSHVLGEEDYLPSSLVTFGDMRVSLREKEYFMLGDNRPFSLDSRRFGILSEEKIIGRVVLRAWPLDSLSKIEAPAY